MKTSPIWPRAGTGRREWLAAGLGKVIALAPVLAAAPAARAAAAPDLRAAIEAFAAGAVVREGKVDIDIAPLVENGNAVPITIAVDSPMSAADHVVAIAVFNERNPQRDVARFTLGPRAGRARVSTRIRLATSQQLVAVARLSDGSFWSGSIDVVVTLAACIE
ncbi:MAG: SoxY-related AACIE arm protein [Burkholderiaceae bacterium]